MSIPNAGGAAGGPRFNRKPALIGVTLVGLFIVAFFYAATQRANRGVAEAEPERVFDQGVEGSDAIDFLEDKPDGLVGVNRNDIGEPAEDAGRQSDFDDRLAEWMEAQEIQKLQRDTQMRERMASRQLEAYEQALASSSKVDGIERRERRAEPDVIVPASMTGAGQAGPGGVQALAGLLGGADAPVGSPAGAGNPLSAVLATLEGQALLATPQGQALAARFGLGGASALPVPAAASPGGALQRAVVGRPADASEFVLDAELQAPRSPYEIKTGTVIPAAMISATSSELPGDIVAQVTRTVHDTASGRFALIPPGTKLFGRYDAYTALGQERLLIVWNRLVFPDGETLDIGGMQGYDARGLAGFRDKVRTHFLKTLGNAFLLSVVGASGDALVAAVGDGPADSVFTLNLAQDFVDTTSAAFDEYLRNRLRISPTIEIRAGYRFSIIVSKDIDFPGPYERGFDAYRASR